MIIINNIVVEEGVTSERFACNLSACKGACCWEGDYGAPLEREEIEQLENLNDVLAPYLDERSNELLAKEGGITFFDEPKIFGTNLHPDGACVYLSVEGEIALCGIEQAWKDGVSDLQKPVSCHLYPVRIDQDFANGFEKMSYDIWDICSAACVKGKKENIKVYEFAKEAIIRKYGSDFYNQLDEAVKQTENQ